jgi:hypothetical protein
MKTPKPKTPKDFGIWTPILNVCLNPFSLWFEEVASGLVLSHLLYTFMGTDLRSPVAPGYNFKSGANSICLSYQQHPSGSEIT